MKLFIYRDNVEARYKSIHVYRGEDNAGVFVCGKLYQNNIDELVKYDISRPFCLRCKSILQKENINMEYLAIVQKLGGKC